jgi:hypothetical protein
MIVWKNLSTSSSLLPVGRGLGGLAERLGGLRGGGHDLLLRGDPDDAAVDAPRQRCAANVRAGEDHVQHLPPRDPFEVHGDLVRPLDAGRLKRPPVHLDLDAGLDGEVRQRHGQRTLHRVSVDGLPQRVPRGNGRFGLSGRRQQ